MLDLKKINEDHSRIFGLIVRAHRLNRRFTLRDLAQKSMLSHTLLNKVEQGQTTITLETYQKITQAFNVDFSQDDEKDKRFFQLESNIYDAIYYAEPQKAHQAFLDLKKDETYYLTSLKMIDYMILAIGVFSHIQYEGLDYIEPFVHTMADVIELGDERQKRRFYLFRAMVNFMRQEPQSVVNDVQQVLDLNHDQFYESLARYILARAHGYLHEIVQSNNNYKRALYLFEQTNNIRRTMYAKAFIAINNMKIYQFEHVMDDLSQVLRYATREKLDWLIYVVRMHMVVYEMLQKRYKQALLHANDIHYRDVRYYGYVAYSAWMCNDINTYEKAIKAAEKSEKPYNDKHRVFEYAVQFLNILGHREAYTDKVFEKALKNFYRATVKANEFFEIELAFEHYQAYLVEKRRYKDAYAITNEMITLVKKTIQ